MLLFVALSTAVAWLTVVLLLIGACRVAARADARARRSASSRLPTHASSGATRTGEACSQAGRRSQVVCAQGRARRSAAAALRRTKAHHCGSTEPVWQRAHEPGCSRTLRMSAHKPHKEKTDDQSE
jgi:hypothetical protein